MSRVIIVYSALVQSPTPNGEEVRTLQKRRVSGPWLVVVLVVSLAIGTGLAALLETRRVSDWPLVATTPYEDATRPNLMVVFRCENNTAQFEAKLLAESNTEALWHIQIFTEQGRKGNGCSAVYRWLGKAHDILVLTHDDPNQPGWYMSSNVLGDGTVYKSVPIANGGYTVLLATVDSLPEGPPLNRGPNGIYVPPKP